MNATTRPAPPDGKYPGSLAEALAVFQAGAPKIGKGNTAEVKNEKGVRLYSYTYADLADVNEEVLPRLGAVGLAFTSRPTMLDGQFVLAYSLIHVSGQREDGVYPLPSANGKPQAIGGAITYARRYCLCAVTGIAAAGDDDDAQAAQDNHRQSAGDVFEKSRPAPQSKPRHAERMASVPADDPWYGDAPAEDAPAAAGPAAPEDAKPTARPRVTREGAAESDPVWLDLMHQEIEQIKTRADGNRAWASIAKAYNNGSCSAADRKGLEGLASGKIAGVVEQEPAKGSAA